MSQVFLNSESQQYFPVSNLSVFLSIIDQRATIIVCMYVCMYVYMYVCIGTSFAIWCQRNSDCWMDSDVYSRAIVVIVINSELVLILVVCCCLVLVSTVVTFYSAPYYSCT